MENPVTMQDITSEKENLIPDYVDLVQAMLCKPKDGTLYIIAEAPSGTYLEKDDIIDTELGKAVVISSLVYVSTSSKHYEFIQSLSGYEIFSAKGCWKYKELRWNK